MFPLRRAVRLSGNGFTFRFAPPRLDFRIDAGKYGSGFGFGRLTKPAIASSLNIRQ